MGLPLVSVVIPTCGRPQYLQRAVESALACAGSNVEVIVVPNGPDESWKNTLSEFSKNRQVQVIPIEILHANAARNHGLNLAQGKYIRFLDDDDYLLPAAAQQVETIEHAGAEICSGLIANIDEDGTPLGQLGFPDSRDFLCAAVSVTGFTLPTGNLFKRDALKGCLWDINVHRAQDYAWMLDLAGAREWRWIHHNKQVGVWFQHKLTRTSSTKSLMDRELVIVKRLLGLYDRIARDEQDTTERRKSIAEALWRYIQLGFPYHPIYWSRIAHQANFINPESAPPDTFYRSWPIRLINPIITQWLLFPIRRITRIMRDTKYRWLGNDYRRRL